MQAAAESVAKNKDLLDVTSVECGALQSEAKSTSGMLKIPTSKYRFVKNTSFIGREDLHELWTGSPLHRIVSMEPADVSYSTRSAEPDHKTAIDLCCKESFQNALRSISNAMSIRQRDLFFALT